MSTEEPVKQYENIGFRPIGLYANHIPAIRWGADNGVYNDPRFRWSTSDKVTVDKKLGTPNVATMLGRTFLKDSETGEYLNLNVLDTDSVTVSNRLRVPIRTILDNSSYDWVTDRLRDLLQTFLNERGVANSNLEETLLDILKKSGYVTKTRKEYGYHFYWLDLKQNPPIGTADCLPGMEFELKTNDKYGLCTLPDSTHRDDPNFRYKAIGLTDVNLVSNVLYDLFLEMFRDCLVNGKLDDNDSVNTTDTSTDTNTSSSNSNTKNRTFNIKNPIVLSDSAIMITAGQMSQFVARKYRNDFYLRFSGMMFHSRIAEESGVKIIAKMCTITNDEESKSRQTILTTTYEKGFNGEEIEGAPKLAELIANKVTGQDLIFATLIVNSLKHVWRMDKKATREREETELIKMSIAEAKRTQSGYVQVRGSIVGMSTVYQMFKSSRVICEDCGYDERTPYDIPLYRPHTKERSRCPNWSKGHKGGNTAVAEYEYTSTVDLWLQDLDRSNDLNRLQVKLFDNNTNDVNTGEIVDAIGHIHVVRNNDSLNSKPESVLFAQDLIYVKRKEVTLTHEDKDRIMTQKADIEKQGKNIIDESIKLFAPQIIGFDHIKKGIFVQCVNAGIKNDETHLPIRMKLNVLLIGDPGTAKGVLSNAALKLIPNCQSVSGMASSGISLIAVVNKDSSGAMSVNLGTLALAKDGIGRINEIGKLKLDQQPHLFDAMEEGITDMVKYGFPANIECHASVLATANPLNNKWKNDDKISVEEFPILLQVAHRFDLIFILRENRDEEFLDNYVDTRATVAKNYKDGAYAGDLEWLQKYIAYARTFNPTIPDDVKIILKHFLKQMAKKDVDGLFRKFDSLLRISIAIAKLKLKNIVDIKDANEAMHMYQLMLKEFRHHVGIPKDPRDVSLDEIRQVVKETYNIVKGGIEYIEAVKKACQRNALVMDYLVKDRNLKGEYLKQKNNNKLRSILYLLRNDLHIVFIGENPIVMKWNPGPSNFSSSNTYNGSILDDVNDVNDVHISDALGKNNVSPLIEKGQAPNPDTSDNSVPIGSPRPEPERENKNISEGSQKGTSSASSASSRIYRLWPGGDRWGCMDCKARGDRFDLEDHICGGGSIKK